MNRSFHLSVVMALMATLTGVNQAQEREPVPRDQAVVKTALATSPTRQAASAQQAEAQEFDLQSILNNLDGQTLTESSFEQPWWQPFVDDPISADVVRYPLSLNDALRMSIEHSAKLSVAEHIPMIRRTAVSEARAAFDWTGFANTVWNDTSDPVGNILTVGGTATRFLEHDLTADLGARRKNLNGGEFEVSQQVGHRNSNSTFFQPNNQGTARLVLSYTQPLLRGRGYLYNRSLVVLANIDVASANDEFSRQLQAHLLEVARAYWGLYLERANLAQKVKLFVRTERIVTQLEQRQAVDTGRSQVISAQAALEIRRADLVRARTAVKNAETRIRALINSPEFAGDPERFEFLPLDHPSLHAVDVDLLAEFETALQNRPEITAAIKAVKAASVRFDMAQHEVLPQLNLVTEMYVAGLQGNSQVGDALLDQFRVGEPGYSVGFQYEVPIGNRAACARKSRRQLELSQLSEEYRSTMELVRAEVEVAVRELRTSHRELLAKNRALQAAEQEMETLEVRWKSLADQGSTGSLLLESLLRAQERVTAAEFEVAKAHLTYNLAIINLRHANGTLFAMDVAGPSDPSADPTLTDPNAWPNQ